MSDGDALNECNEDDSDDVNIIKLQDSDIDKIVNFVNEEERRRIKKDQSQKRIEREKIENKPENDIHSLFKEKKEDENVDKEDLTREDLVEKLKRDDASIRYYIESIIKSGLTLGNKRINKLFQKRSILMYKDFNLGKFKFNQNFYGIKDYNIKLAQFRPLSGKDNKNQNQEDNDKNDKNNDDKEKEKEKEKNSRKSIIIMDKNDKKKKKELIYDNKYLLASKKNKKQVRFILRKEVEEILNGGILLQQQEIEEKSIKEIKKKKFDSPEKKKICQKKRKKLHFIKKIRFFNGFERRREKERILKELRLQEEIKDKKLGMKIAVFLKRIKELKNKDLTGFHHNEIDTYMNESYKKDINEREKKEKELRINQFLSRLNDYRYAKKKKREINDTYLYKEPILVENLILENNINKTNRTCISNNKVNNNKIEKDKKYKSYYFNRNSEETNKKRSKSYITEIDY